MELLKRSRVPVSPFSKFGKYRFNFLAVIYNQELTVLPVENPAQEEPSSRQPKY
ncbi:hypothetical protein GCM10027592_48380 [Spirosoma flavus]